MKIKNLLLIIASVFLFGMLTACNVENQVINGRVSAVCPDGYKLENKRHEDYIEFNKKIDESTFDSYSIYRTTEAGYDFYDSLIPDTTFLIKDTRNRSYSFNIYMLRNRAHYVTKFPLDTGYIHIQIVGPVTEADIISFLNDCEWE